MVKRAGVPMEKTYLEKFANELGKSDAEERRAEAEERKKWEEQRTSEVGSNVAQNVAGRSALSRRTTSGEKADLFMPSFLGPDSIATIAKDKSDLQQEMNVNGNDNRQLGREVQLSSAGSEAAAERVSELISKAGAGSSFDGESLGIGGLDDVLAQVKRRVWTPLAAPPQLLEELGIHPVRGLLLYGKPGCGKTLLARTLGSILSPMRPITVVSGPEIMDKFVGSSEKVRIAFATHLKKKCITQPLYSWKISLESEGHL
jgi:ATP-dependent 26S proteasome regulatory subunit